MTSKTAEDFFNFHRFGRKSSIYKLGTSKEEPMIILPFDEMYDTNPLWSPSGKYLAYYELGDFYILDTEYLFSRGRKERGVSK
jgi:hypothetical protein